ncbi:DUF1223 domain-containing protein [Sphingomonas suaedae]|uniref:DUF1223 domain-containing protein n=1 Tax=Sphingomonas suaedae TaxID=2599297 RepID=A0A518RHH2_9SPHN|nr:DUF1223 domain-containing protein [Sphingomonas suaedae]QDX26918.1 DUF1223 domain-containing protein [Sphingomonas suaedae]
MKSIYLSAAIGALALGGVGLTVNAQRSPDVRPPVGNRAPPEPARLTVVELFQSQGCSSCPPAAANVNAIAGQPNVLALSYGVTYWDQLGWKDSFASPQFTERQWEYARSRGRARVWTPQVYVNGQRDLVGSNRAQLNQTIAASSIKGPSVSVSGGKVHIGAGRAARRATIWMVRYDPRTVNVPIRAGENGGRTLPHRNIVRQLTRLGQWTGAATSFSLPVPRDGFRTAILVQDGKGGAIIGAVKA